MRLGITARCCAVSVLAITGSEAMAQTEPSPVKDEIVVTARKRVEKEVDVPVSITVLRDQPAIAASLDPGAEIARLAPNTNFLDMSRPNDRFATMRGVAPLGTPLNSLDNSVGFATDGVPTSSFGFSPPLFDIDRIEVLRGPQGTLFGRNALGGLINVITAKADGQTAFSATAEAGENGHRLLDSHAGGWVVQDRLALRIAGRYQEYGGDVPNILLGGKEGGAKVSAGRASLRFTPDETLRIDLTGSYSRDQRSNTVWLLRSAPGFPVSSNDVRPEGERKIGSVSLEIEKTLGGVVLTSVTNYQHIDIYSFDEFTDSLIYSAWLGGSLSDWADPTVDIGSVRDRERLFNQEIRLSSTPDAAMSWVVGANYFRSEYRTQRDMQSSMWPTANGLTDNRIDSETIAAFGDITIPLGERLWVSGGLRLAHDRQKLEGSYLSNGFPGTVPSLLQNNQYSDTYLTGRGALSWKLSDRATTYASVTHGYASGGFERTTQNAPYGTRATPFRPSRIWTYEAGFKLEQPQRVKLEASVFYNDVTDGQLSGFDTQTFQVAFGNQDYRSYGFDAMATLYPTPELELNAGVGFTHSDTVNPLPIADVGLAVGKRVPQVPDWTATAGLRYRLEGSRISIPGAFTFDGSWQYVGDRPSDIQNAAILPSYDIVNLRLEWKLGRVAIYGFARNLFDKRPLAYASAYTPEVVAVIAGRGRVAGAGINFSW